MNLAYLKMLRHETNCLHTTRKDDSTRIAPKECKEFLHFTKRIWHSTLHKKNLSNTLTTRIHYCLFESLYYERRWLWYHQPKMLVENAFILFQTFQNFQQKQSECVFEISGSRLGKSAPVWCSLLYMWVVSVRKESLQRTLEETYHEDHPSCDRQWWCGYK